MPPSPSEPASGNVGNAMTASANPGPPASPRPRMAPLIIGGLVLAGLILYGVLSHVRPVVGIQASGTIEATESEISPKVQGRLIALRVRDGDAVKKGERLAVLERLDPMLSLKQARAGVAAALAQVNVAEAAYELQRATYETTLAQARPGLGIARSHLSQAGENLTIASRAAALGVDQAEAELTAARATYAHSRADLARVKSLVRTGDEPKQSLDDATNTQASAAAQLQAAQDALALERTNLGTVQVHQLDVKASSLQQHQAVAILENAQAEEQLVTERRAQLAAARANLAQMRATLGLAQDQVRETQLLAPFDGYVISHNFEVGDLISSGSAVLTIGDLTHPYVNVYVSESDLPRIKSGMHANVVIDGMPGRTFVGTVTEISNTAEFTPENVQTKEERVEYLVFRVKIQFTDTTGTLKPGLPADAVLP